MLFVEHAVACRITSSKCRIRALESSALHSSECRPRYLTPGSSPVIYVWLRSIARGHDVRQVKSKRDCRERPDFPLPLVNGIAHSMERAVDIWVWAGVNGLI